MSGTRSRGLACPGLLDPATATVLAAIGLCTVAIFLADDSSLAAEQQRQPVAAATSACANADSGITLPPGFCATVFADNVGHARHLVVAPNGVVYVNTWSGRYYGNTPPHDGGFLVALQDTTGDGRADVVTRFGPDANSGNAGGTGVALYDGALYAETNDRIVRYALPPGSIAPTAPPDVIVSGLPLTGDHPMHPFQIDAQGQLYVDLGSATNSCQGQNRMPNSPGINPCTELETRAGIWRYDAKRIDQKFSAAGRFATGLRNGEGIAFDSAGRVLATQHGRDQLSQNFSKLYTTDQGANEPAEELVQLERGADYGWPYCYFDITQQKLLLAPEYGGDGKPRAYARRSTRRSRAFRRIGRPTIWCFTRVSSFQPPTAAGRSSRSTGPGTARRYRRAVTTSSFSRSPTASLQETTSSSPMVSRGPSKSPVKRCTGPRDSPSALMARSTSPMIKRAASIA